MLTPEQIADGWIEHDGNPIGKYLYMDTPVIFRSGKEGTRKHGWFIWDAEAPLHSDIIAYKPEPTP